MTDISNPLWSVVDASNTAASPNGWAVGLAANQVRPVGQQMMGATKRWWERANAAITTTGSAGAYVYTPTNTSYPSVYTQGEVYAAKANFTSVGNDTLNVNSLGAKALYKPSSTGPVKIVAGDIRSGQVFAGMYDSALNSGNGGLHVIAGLSALGNATPVILASGNVTASATFLTANLSSYSAFNRIEIQFDSLISDTVPGHFELTFSTDAGSSFITTGYAYQNGILGNTYGSVNSNSAAYIMPGLATNASPGYFNMSFIFDGINKAVPTFVTGRLDQRSTSVYSYAIPILFTGQNLTTTINAVKFVIGGGASIVSGKYRIIGYI